MMRPSITDSRTQLWRQRALAFGLAAAVVLASSFARADEVLGRDAAPVVKTRLRMTDANGNVVGRRPHGCPYRFCGCEASLYLFGRIIPDLNLAWNWVVKFPRTSPAPQMAAARHGHVMVLLAHVSGDDWLVHDGNSGGGLTREHVVSIRGFVIVDPHGVKVAAR